MINLKCNFKSAQKDLKCRLCGQHDENQQGLLVCEPLRESQEVDMSESYTDIYNEDKEKITKIAMILKEKFKKFQHYQVHGQSTDNNPCAASLSLVNSHTNSGDMDWNI